MARQRRGLRFAALVLTLGLLIIGCAGTRPVGDSASDSAGTTAATTTLEVSSGPPSSGEAETAETIVGTGFDSLIGRYTSVEATGAGLSADTVFEIEFTADTMSLTQPCGVDFDYAVTDLSVTGGEQSSGTVSIAADGFSMWCTGVGDSSGSVASQGSDATVWLIELLGTAQFTLAGDMLTFTSDSGDRLALQRDSGGDASTTVPGLDGRWVSTMYYPSDSWSRATGPSMPPPDPDAPPPTDPIRDDQSIIFDGDELTAITGCGPTTARFEIHAGTVDVDTGSFGIPPVGCVAGPFTELFLSLLANGPTAKVEGDQLTLTAADGVTGVTLFRSATVGDPVLEAHAWQLTDYRYDGQDPVSVPARTVATLDITDGRMDLDAGCNGIWGIVIAEAGAIVVTGSLWPGSVTSTAMGCGEPAATLELVLTAPFTGVVEYRIGNGVLTVTGGEISLTLVPAG